MGGGGGTGGGPAGFADEGAGAAAAPLPATIGPGLTASTWGGGAAPKSNTLPLEPGSEGAFFNRASKSSFSVGSMRVTSTSSLSFKVGRKSSTRRSWPRPPARCGTAGDRDGALVAGIAANGPFPAGVAVAGPDGDESRFQKNTTTSTTTSPPRIARRLRSVPTFAGTSFMAPASPPLARRYRASYSRSAWSNSQAAQP